MEDLPGEIIHHILSFLNFEDWCNCRLSHPLFLVDSPQAVYKRTKKRCRFETCTNSRDYSRYCHTHLHLDPNCELFQFVIRNRDLPIRILGRRQTLRESFVILNYLVKVLPNPCIESISSIFDPYEDRLEVIGQYLLQDYDEIQDMLADTSDEALWHISEVRDLIKMFLSQLDLVPGKYPYFNKLRLLLHQR